MTDEMTIIVRDNAGTLLTAMLQRVQAEVGESGGVRVAPNAENTAFYRSTLPTGGYKRQLPGSPSVALGMSGMSNSCSNFLIC